MRNCSGDPIKFRDGSDDNVVKDSYIERSGYSAFFRDDTLNNSLEKTCSDNHLSGNVVTFPHRDRTSVQLTEGYTGSFVLDDSEQDDAKYFQGGTPTDEQVTAVVVANIDTDDKDKAFVAFHYPEFNFTKVTRTNGGQWLEKVVYSSVYRKVTDMVALPSAGTDKVVTAFRHYPSTSNITQVHRGYGATALTDLGKLFDSSSWTVQAMTTGNFNGLGNTELITAFSVPVGSAQETRIYSGDGTTTTTQQNTGNGTLVTNLYTSQNWDVAAMTAGDLNGGGLPDLITAFHQKNGSLTTRIYIAMVRLPQPAGATSMMTPIGGSTGWPLATTIHAGNS